jgi:hypothetical protein
VLFRRIANKVTVIDCNHVDLADVQRLALQIVDSMIVNSVSNEVPWFLYTPDSTPGTKHYCKNSQIALFTFVALRGRQGQIFRSLLKGGLLEIECIRYLVVRRWRLRTKVNTSRSSQDRRQVAPRAG